jgi:hypothetical protein
VAARPDIQVRFAWMQARLVELLLRHDAPALASAIGERPGGALDDPRLARHRELAALWHLRGELFEGVLPQIKRRLSFAAPRELGVEPLPTRGRVDWAQTAAAGLRDRPGQAPLEARTRQRRRSFGTPESLLVVVTLLEYRQAAERLLAAEVVSAGAAALRHPLHDIVAACERELAIPPLAGLRAEAERIVAGLGELTPGELQRLAEGQLPPGRTGAYDDLIAWRERLAALQLAAPGAPDPAAPAVGADPERDDLLYQTWLFLELADLLRRRDRLVEVGGGRLRYTWGDGGERRPYVLWLRPERGGPWREGPAAQPALLVEREARREVRSEGRLVWGEPGYAVAASFAPGADAGGAVRRLLGDLQLTGGRRGALLVAHGQGPAGVDGAAPCSVGPEPPIDVDAPGLRVDVYRVAPAPGDEGSPLAALGLLLDAAHAAVGPAVPIACHGVFLDALSAAERGSLAGRDGAALDGDPAELLICPKPHIGPWRADLVSRSRHCCQDPRLCHIVGQPGARRPVRPPRTTDDLLRELGQLFDARAPGEIDEQEIDVVARRVEELTRRFAEVAGDFGDVALYEGRLRDAGMDRTLHMLGPGERESLALAVYLVDKLDRVRATDFSAPTIHLARVLEREIQRRVMAVPGVEAGDFPHGKPTLGSLAGTRRRRPEVWAKIAAALDARWDGRVDGADPAFAIAFEDFVEQLQPVVHARNQAAHTTPVPRERYRRLFGDMCHGGALRVGVLNALLLAWPA